MKEEWKDIKGYEGLYQTSNLGNIKSLINNKILKICKIRTGYHIVSLYKNKKQKKYCVHRLVALSFVPNLKNKPQVNHKDGNKSNNKANNLEWCTASENLQHAWNMGLNKNTKKKIESCKKNALIANEATKKKIKQYSKDNVFLKEWNSISEAEKQLGVDGSCISKVCRNKRKTAGGFIWKYKTLIVE